MIRLLCFVVPLLALASCQEMDPHFCGMHPTDTRCMNMPGAACEKNSDCQDANKAVCDLQKGDGECVQCTATSAAACGGPTPICVNDACTGCTKHSDCTESNVCMPDGSCAKSTDVAYVDGTSGMGGMCTKPMPCKSLDMAAMKKSLIKVTGTLTDRYQFNNVELTILADPGSKIQPITGGVVFEVKGSSHIQVFDLQIGNAMSASNITIADTANLELTRVTVRDGATSGISMNSGQLTCTRCTITANTTRGIDAAVKGSITLTQSTISFNTDGGVRIQDDVTYRIVNNIFFKNGRTTASSAGLFINTNSRPGDASTDQLDFNSFSKNRSLAAASQAIDCSSGTPLKASNNIFWGNGDTPQAQNQVNTDGQCNWSYSDIGPMALATPATNLNMDPKFVDDSDAVGDLHLKSESPLQGAADPATMLTDLAAKDIDGEMRANRGTGKGADIGADQYYPPGSH